MGQAYPLTPPGDSDFANRILIGPGISGVKTHFPSIQSAITHVKNLILGGDPNAPGPNNRWLFQLEPVDFTESLLYIPDWVWVKGFGPTATRIIQDGNHGGANADYLMSFGLGGLSDLGLFGINGPLIRLGGWLRDSQSVYSFLKEPFAVVGGETLSIQDGSGGSVYPVTLQAGDTTAALIAARIDAAVGGSVVALEVAGPGNSGYLRIGSNLNANEIIVGAGTANVLLGWPATGIIGYDPPAEDEFRWVDNVSVILAGGDAGANDSVCLSSDEISWPINMLKNLYLVNGQGSSGSALRYPGSLYVCQGLDIPISNTGILVAEAPGIAASTNSWLNLRRCSIGDPQGQVINDLHYGNGTQSLQVQLQNSTFNEQKVTNSTGQTINFSQYNVPYQEDYQESEGITSTTVAAYGVIKLQGSVPHSQPGRYKVEVTFEAKADAAAPVRQCLIRLRNSRTAAIYMDIAENTTDWKTHTTIKEFVVPTGLGIGSDDMILEFGTSNVGQAVSIRNARISIWRTG